MKKEISKFYEEHKERLRKTLNGNEDISKEDVLLWIEGQIKMYKKEWRAFGIEEKPSMGTILYNIKCDIE